MPTLEFKGKQFVYAHHLTVPFRPLVIDEKLSLPPKGEKPTLDDNLIIHADNLHGLKALVPTFAGKVDCIFADPPYNTGNESWCYNDNVNSPLMREWVRKNSPVDRDDLERHEKWLCMMWPRLKLIHELLSEGGSFWVTLDDNEVHWARAILNEVFGEENFVATCIWHKMDSPKNTAQHFSEDHDYLLVYAKNAATWSPNLLQRSEEMKARYKNPDNDPRGPWLLSDLAARNQYSQGLYEIETPSGKVIQGPPAGSYWRVSKKRFDELNKDNRIWWGADGSNRPGIKRFLSEVRQGVVPQTIWRWQEVGSTRNAKQELARILGKNAGEEIFITPKPVDLLLRIITLATNDQSIVLDPFAGSGATAHAVLTQNRIDAGTRQFILLECEDYAATLTADRVRRAMQGFKATGTQRTELYRTRLNWAQLQKAPEMVDKVESIERLEGADFDRVAKTVEDGSLVVTGEKMITEKVEGLGGSFTFCTLGDEITMDGLLSGKNMPDYDSLAKYVFYTATGQTLAKVPKPKADWFIGETANYRVHLIYRSDRDWLRGNDAMLDAPTVEKIAAGLDKQHKALVFAPSKFMSQRELTPRRVEFCQLPYAIYRILGD